MVSRAPARVAPSLCKCIAQGRRNLTADWFRYLLGRRYNRAKQAKGSNNQYVQAKSEKGQIGPLIETTAARLAKEHTVAEATVKRAGKFAATSQPMPRFFLLRQSLWAEMRAGGMSYRQIADADGTVSHETVASSVRNLTVDQPEHVTGRDGKKRAATKVAPRPRGSALGGLLSHLGQ